MCWFSKSYPNIREVLEEKDTIKVKKVVLKLPGGSLWSVYRGYKYELGKLCQMNEFDICKRENTLNKPYWLCNSAFHSYIESVKVYYDLQRKNCCVDYNNWSLDYFDYNEIYYHNLSILHCLIPKDSRYCINAQGEVISDKILPLYTEEINLGTYTEEINLE